MGKDNSLAATDTSGRDARGRKARGRPFAGVDSVGRDMLIEVTRDILKTTPPDAVTRLMIAERAGVDPALIRYYFGTVPHLVAQVVVDTHRRIHRVLGDIITTNDTTEWVRARVGEIVDMFIENPLHHQLIKHVMYGPASGLEHQEWIASLRVSVQHTTALIDTGVKTGVFRQVDPRMLHVAFIGIGEFFGSNADIVSDIFGGEESVRTLRDRYVEFIVDLFLDGIRVRP